MTSFAGAYASYFLDGATGGIIVVLQTLIFLVAFVFAPKHGMLAARRRGARSAGGRSMSDLFQTLLQPFQFAFMQQAFVIAVLVAVPMALLSCFLVLKGWSLMGDAISHAVLPGVVLAYIAGIPLAIGAFAAGMVCALATGYLKENSRVKEDTAMGVVFSGMFGLGIVLYTKIQTEVHLDHILFGDMLGVSWRDVGRKRRHRRARGGSIMIFRRDLLLHAFDPQHARAIGLPVRLLHYGLLAILSLTIVGALKAVGIILAIAMLIAPGAIAFLLTSRFGRDAGRSAVAIAVLASFFGVYLSLLHRIRAGADHRALDEPGLRRRLFRVAAAGKAGRTPSCRRNARPLKVSGETPEPGSVAFEPDYPGAAFARKSVTGEGLGHATEAKIDDDGLGSKIEGADDLLVALTAREGDRIALDRQKFDLALGKCWIGAAKGQEAAIVLKQRFFIALLPVDGKRQVFRPEPAARAAGRKSGVRLRIVPDHRRAAAVAALELRPERDAVRVLQVLEGEIGFGETQLLALIEADRSAQRQQQRRDHLEIGEPIRLAGAPAVACRTTSWLEKAQHAQPSLAALPKLSSTVADIARADIFGARKSKA